MFSFFLRHQHECATLIQRAYRAYTTRKWYRRKVQVCLDDISKLLLIFIIFVFMNHQSGRDLNMEHRGTGLWFTLVLIHIYQSN